VLSWSTPTSSALTSSFWETIGIGDSEPFDFDGETLIEDSIGALFISDHGQRMMTIELTNGTHGASGFGHTLNPEARVFTPALSRDNTTATVNTTTSALTADPAGQEAPIPTLFAVPITPQVVNADLGGNTPPCHTSTTHATAHGTFAAGLAGLEFQASTFPYGMNNTHQLVDPYNDMGLQTPVHANELYGAHDDSPYATYNHTAGQALPYNNAQVRHVGVSPPFPGGNPSMTTVTIGLPTDTNQAIQVGTVVSSLAIVNYGRTPAERHTGYNALRQLHYIWINPARRPVRGMYYFDGEHFHLHQREENHYPPHGYSYRGHGADDHAVGRGGYAARDRDTYSPGPY